MRFGEVLSALSVVYAVPSGYQTRFLAKLQYFQKRGWPSDTKTGRGHRATWSEAGLLQVWLLLELTMMGFAQERAIAILVANMAHLNDLPDHRSQLVIGCPFSFGSPHSSSLIIPLERYAATLAEIARAHRTEAAVSQ